mmetsp:Transcript_2434/g.7295  ORF Transcript_2434/g.7295 Transcript_2434/m.7295 type:complete len:201 (+) Transcript_2434:2720-3322(+)
MAACTRALTSAIMASAPSWPVGRGRRLRAGSAVKGSLAVGLNLGRDARAAAAAATAPWGRGLTGARGLRSMLVARSAVCANALAAWKLSRLPTTAGRAFGGLSSLGMGELPRDDSREYCLAAMKGLIFLSPMGDGSSPEVANGAVPKGLCTLAVLPPAIDCCELCWKGDGRCCIMEEMALDTVDEAALLAPTLPGWLPPE